MYTSSKQWLLRILLAIRDVLNPLFRFHEVSVLCYHSISDSAVDTAVTRAVFESHLTMLKESGAEFISVEHLADWLDGKAALPRRAVVLTFDDGYYDFLTDALPLLQKYNAPACVFVVGNESEARIKLGNTIPLLPPEEITTLTQHVLVTIGYHSYSHANFLKSDLDELERECAPLFHARYFAYPGGNYTPDSVTTVAQMGYRAAFCIKPDLVTRHSPRYLVPRTVILGSTQTWAVRAATTRAVSWYRALRGATK